MSKTSSNSECNRVKRFYDGQGADRQATQCEDRSCFSFGIPSY